MWDKKHLKWSFKLHYLLGVFKKTDQSIKPIKK
jgi:hypothetical protein